jgi:hypothetical protein
LTSGCMVGMRFASNPSVGDFRRLRHLAGLWAYRPLAVCAMNTNARSQVSVTAQQSNGRTAIRPLYAGELRNGLRSLR